MEGAALAQQGLLERWARSPGGSVRRATACRSPSWSWVLATYSWAFPLACWLAGQVVKCAALCFVTAADWVRARCAIGRAASRSATVDSVPLLPKSLIAGSLPLGHTISVYLVFC